MHAQLASQLMHLRCRDLKPENFLLSDKAENAPLKATDFGLSVFYKPGQVFNDVVGSAYYVAPEVCLQPCHALPSSCFTYLLNSMPRHIMSL